MPHTSAALDKEITELLETNVLGLEQLIDQSLVV